jgi:hypothetical protein
MRPSQEDGADSSGNSGAIAGPTQQATCYATSGTITRPTVTTAPLSTIASLAMGTAELLRLVGTVRRLALDRNRPASEALGSIQVIRRRGHRIGAMPLDPSSCVVNYPHGAAGRCGRERRSSRREA